MRISLSVKVFFLFSTLTVITIGLSVTSFFSYDASIKSAARIMALKDFSLHLERLNVMSAQVFLNHTPAMEKDILDELEHVKAQIKNIPDFSYIHSFKIARRFEELPHVFNSFQKSFIYLLEQYDRHRQIPEDNYSILSVIAKQADVLSDIDHKQFYQVINTLWVQVTHSFEHHDLDQYPGLMQTQKTIAEITKDPAINSAVRDLIHNIEDDLVLHFSLRYQEQFLKNSSHRFFVLINDGIRVIQEENATRQAEYKSMVIIVSLFAVLINLGLWLVISRYFNRFLESQKNAIQAIKSENFEYDFPPPSNDEIGDLSLGMKNLAQSLSRARERYWNIFFNAADAIAILGLDGRFIDINTEACRMLGYTREELLSKTADQIDVNLVHDNDGDVLYNRLISEQTVTVYRTYQRKDKSLMPAEVKLSLIKTSIYDRFDGRIEVPENQMYLLYVRDITQRKAVEKALRQSEEKYRSMMETMKDPVYICSPDYTVIYMNPAMIERTCTDVTGHKCYRTIHGLDDICPWCGWQDETFLDDYSKEISSPLDGRFYNISCSSIVMSDDQRLKLFIYRDITEVKQLENQLLHAQKMESIGTLAGGIAHDFNNILFPIMGYTEILLQDAPEQGLLRKGLEKIYAGAKRAKELVSRILAFSRQDRGETRLLEVPDVIHEALNLLRASIPATIEMDIRISSHCKPIMADPVQIHQIIMNLATNAFHAMEESGGIMTICLEEKTITSGSPESFSVSEGVYNLLTVTDTGVGMSAQVQEKIFDPYFTTKELGKGTGMGLAVVHGVVSQMGGAVNVTTRPGHGTTFRVYLPVPENGVASDEEKETGKGSEVPDLSGGDEHILVVDDEPDVMVIEKAMLERFGYRVTGMNNGYEALDTFRQSPEDFHLVITDLTMPGLSGAALAEQLRGIRKELPILFCTGFSGKKIPDIPGEEDITGKLVKPIDVRQMIQSVRSLLDRVHENRF